MLRKRLGKSPVSLLSKAIGASAPAMMLIKETEK